ncbi:metaxin-1-like [Polypterus senegalus]|uniref:metaxin-1-like n=1 Tax=Polypterus senegalus TaxID=55291 RepID=UPI0019642F3B|nr:metaxin-1-like [Polypterus senegalus]
MATAMELYCWKGDWDLPSVDPDCLTVLAYARFSGAPLKVHKITNPWKSPTGGLPALKTKDDGYISQPHKMIIHFRKQKYNADYDLSAKEGADTLAFICLMEEKFLPALIYTLWVDSKNYVDVTRRWYAENIPFPLNFFLPNRMHSSFLDRLRLIKGDNGLEPGEEAEKELYRDAVECMTLLSQRLGNQTFFFGQSPSSLDAHVFGLLAPLLKMKLPSNKLQQHLKSLDNLCHFCSNILTLYFPPEGADGPSRKASSPHGGEHSDFDNEPHKRRNQILSVLVALGAMLSYAFLTGIVSVHRVASHHAVQKTDAVHIGEDEVNGEDE